MKVHPQVTHMNGIITVALIPQFIGDETDDNDRARIGAYGQPMINLGGSFSDDQTPTPFTFSTGSPEVQAGVITAMPNMPARFMSENPTSQGSLDVITPNPVLAATIYAAAIQARVATAFQALRALTPEKLTSLPDQTV